MPENTPGDKAPLFRRIGPIEHVTLQLPDTATLPTTEQAAPGDDSQTLPTQFYPISDWHLSDWYLTHNSLISDELVSWNWQYKEWFSDGNGLSTYYLRDEDLLDTIARIFSRLVPVRTGDGTAQDHEYRVAASSDSPSGILPGLFLYASASGDAHFLALYSQHSVGPNQSIRPSVTIHEIAQVEIADMEAVHMALYGAQQAAIRYQKEFWS